ncbi:MAG: hypothetical protein JWM13_1250 [Arthrobacter sp.]|nr:hypothetical protein [Arthrobacter sp.]
MTVAPEAAVGPLARPEETGLRDEVRTARCRDVLIAAPQSISVFCGA